MILHIFPREKFTVAFINFINKNFDKEKHLFFLYGVNKGFEGNNLEYELNVKDVNKDKGMFLKAIYNTNKIIMHSLFISNKLLLFLSMQQWLLKKCNWIVWGEDLYSYRKEKIRFRDKLNEFIRRIFIKNISVIATLVKEDYDLAIKWYDTKAKYYRAIYMDTETIEYLEGIKNSNKKNKEYVNIQIGNSATLTNNHIEVLELLKKYKQENIKIYCPLSYGDTDYAEKVIEYGKRIFEDKFIPLTKFLGIHEYMDLLNNIDVGIFNNDRQQALGNIFSLIYLGKKVYIRDDTSMWNEINTSLNLQLSTINQLKKENFNSFIHIDETDKQLNYERLKPRYDNESIRLIWEEIFSKNI
ncbi:4-alpha-L-fucosyltransferase [Clostridium botulinum]|uniref:4-alpha-L-fucosyltransferase n=1 Tax=Clostridium botulinum TaxID=1491 RepID=A0A6M0SND3_CLOBO|nr:4-alpha-L-fucosyltransferase [Clostridium botulinum]